MSTEYIINAEKISQEAIDSINRSINAKFPNSHQAGHGCLWIPSINPKWVDFSIEKIDDGLFVVSNLNGKDLEIILEIIDKVLTDFGVSYSVREV